MSIPFVPGLEQGTSFEGNIEINESDVSTYIFCAGKEIPKVSREEISDFGEEGFLLQNVFTLEECEEIIANGEKIGFQTIIGVKDDYRSCKRITLQSQSLADALWLRIKDHVTDIDIEGDPHIQHIHGSPMLMKGTWTPVCLNNIFRLCRYLPGGHFAPHFDGHFDRSANERSLKTFMVYLNGGFEGGATNFVDDRQQLYKDESTGKYCAEETNILCSIKPEAGLAIIFNHFRLHEGEQLKSGQKYILRTDVMYKNVDQNLSEDFVIAVGLLQRAETLENGGECLQAAEMYRKAFKLAPELEKVT
ncbi:uncharacterized protein LOC127873132 isoform X1 [Dreissena polymorpha]|uniref:Fe2OG dioxygenase domain-containing protein n=1 Tax=Dreissena polymorpha TaxID=45954 RepID=A0A9D4QXL1_DREPO|nr:uncharacterized protein LOC127873132 isoform X1 [Dreissena polymorpha]KAH3845835.1 hypothetical protein DPMN_088125 [Dreissena polymorpha]